MTPSTLNLSEIFQSVAERLEHHREAFNRADEINGDHGDHLIEVFKTAARAAQRYGGEELSEAMETAAEELRRLDYGTAWVYAEGLSAFGRAFRSYDIGEADLTAYLNAVLSDTPSKSSQERGAEILRALVAGLQNWQQAAETGSEGEPAKERSGLSASSLFDLGIVYMQAKSRGGSRSQVLADAAVTSSPLNRVPHRAQSGKMAVRAFLEAFQTAGDQE